jgi:lipopolysaccharide/colanic/teichoic acid biosynthesis glycosyltransferase
MYKFFLKRVLDIIIAFVVLLITLPITIIVFVILFYQNKGKAFFFQERPGLHQKAFTIIKFKTMTDSRDENGQLLSDNQRITHAGKIFRQLSIDELPQLLNVLIGDMSLIGPRPLLFKYIPLYNSVQLRRHEMRPGITGWAQVNGRNTISWNNKFDYDVYYIDHASFLLDLKILWMTALKVVQRDGINQTYDRPMQPFNGNN